MAVQCHCGNKYVELPEGLRDLREHAKRCPYYGACTVCGGTFRVYKDALGRVLMCEHEIKGVAFTCDGSRMVPQVTMNADRERITDDPSTDFREEG